MSINISGLDIEKIMLNNENITGVYLGDTLIEDFQTKLFFRRDSNGFITAPGYQLIENSDFDSQYRDKWYHYRTTPNDYRNFGYNPSQLAIQDSNLIINIKNNKNNTWTSGMVSSRFNVRANSVIEARVKVPTKDYYYSAISIEPLNCDNYPLGYSATFLLDHTVNFNTIYIGTQYYGGSINAPNEIGEESYWQNKELDDTDYHTVGIIWTDDEIVYYVDDRILGKLPTQLGLVDGINAFGGDFEMYIFVMPTENSSTEDSDDKLYVDWVRVYNIV